MEVHHPLQPRHKKNWSEFIIEFLMLFTAVTLGFFAENVREQMSEKQKKRELLQTVAKDLQAELKQFEFHKNFGQKKIINCDSLILLNNSDHSKVDQKIYYSLLIRTMWWWHFNPNEKSRNEAEAKGYFTEKENTELNYYISKFNFFKNDLKDMEQIEGNAHKFIIAEFPNFTEHALLDKQLRVPSLDITSKLGIKRIDEQTATKLNYQFSVLKLCSDMYIMNIDSMTVYAKKSIDLINKEYK